MAIYPCAATVPQPIYSTRLGGHFLKMVTLFVSRNADARERDASRPACDSSAKAVPAIKLMACELNRFDASANKGERGDGAQGRHRNQASDICFYSLFCGEDRLDTIKSASSRFAKSKRRKRRQRDGGKPAFVPGQNPRLYWR